MQTDEEIGKVAAAVPVIISRALELFLESLLTKACQVTQSRNAKTMTMSHFPATKGPAYIISVILSLTQIMKTFKERGSTVMKKASGHPRKSSKCQDRLLKLIQLQDRGTTSAVCPGMAAGRKQCIELEQQFDFLKDLVAAMPDVQGDMEDSHTEGGDRVSRRGGKPVSGRKNGGVSTKGKEKKQSGTESEQEDDSEESETEEDEEEEGSQSSTNLQTASHFNSSSVGPNAVTQYDHMRAAQGLALPLGNFTPMNSSLLHAVPVLPACHGNGDDDDDDEDYDC
ncbi:uncharacterized protein [Paramormyrops kingsleyae]